jgi:hypothetical protein
MEEVRESIIYKNSPIELCLKELTSIEQYELVRLIALFPEKSIRICTHENTSTYIKDILNQLHNLVFFQCFSPSTTNSFGGTNLCWRS